MNVTNIIKLVTCVAAQDGVISDVELETAYKLINTKIKKIDKKFFNSCVSEFFDEDLTIEEYLHAIPKDLDLNIILGICHDAASSDGLEIRENYAFDKACNFWRVDSSKFSKD